MKKENIWMWSITAYTRRMSLVLGVLLFLWFQVSQQNSQGQGKKHILTANAGN